MLFPFIIKSDRLCKIISPFMKIKGITLWPFVITRSNVNWVTLNHECIHIKQQIELLIIPFYIWYFSEWIWGLFKYRSGIKAYLNISFEREAYANDCDQYYLKSRKPYSFLKYLKK